MPRGTWERRAHTHVNTALRDQILAGEVSGAIARVSECVSCPQKRSRLLFRLRCQEFVESIRSGGGDPLQYARMHLQEYGRADAVLYNELQVRRQRPTM